MTNKAETLVLELNNKCNNNCTYCYQTKNTQDNEKNVNFFKKQIVKFKKNGLRYIEFSGGEPTLCSYLPELINFARLAGYENITVLTNGRRFSYPDYCTKLARAGLKTVIISYPAHNKKLYKQITKAGEDGFFQVETAFKNLKELGLSIGSVTVLTNLNLRFLRSIVTKLKYKKLSFITLSYPIPRGGVKIDFPSQKKAAIVVNDVLKYFSEEKICVEGIPGCLLKPNPRTILNELFNNEALIIDFKGKFQKRLEEIRMLSTQISGCFLCNRQKECPGFFVEAPREKTLELQKTALDIQNGPCEYECIFCTRQVDGKPFLKLTGKKYRSKIDWAMIARFFKTSIGISDSLDIWGRERADRFPQIESILRLAKKSGFRYITLWSSGLRFLKKEKISKFVKIGVTKFEIPIYGYGSIHDEIVVRRGSFGKILKGLKNIASFKKAKIGIHMVALRQNAASLPDLINLLHAFKKIELVVWSYYPDPRLNWRKEDVYRSCSISYSDLIAFFYAKKNLFAGVNLSLAFWPLCIFYKLKKEFKLFKLIKTGPVRLLVVDNKETSYRFLSGRGEFNSTHANKCRDCVMKKTCTGVFKEYLKIYGDKELEPFRNRIII